MYPFWTYARRVARLMYDALNPNNIPTSAQMVASYIDGSNAPPPGWQARFPHAVIVSICREPGLNHGNVIDCESSTYVTPALAASWVRLRRSAGAIPTVYASSSVIPAVLGACAAIGQAAPLLWVANWNGQDAPWPGAVAHQYGGAPGYDLSWVADYWPGVDGHAPTPAPTPPPTPVPPPVTTPPTSSTAALGLFLVAGAGGLAWYEVRRKGIRITIASTTKVAQFGSGKRVVTHVTRPSNPPTTVPGQFGSRGR